VETGGRGGNGALACSFFLRVASFRVRKKNQNRLVTVFFEERRGVNLTRLRGRQTKEGSLSVRRSDG
jgi:hypothetical protein